ncbi:uncharacterized protein LOC123675891 [Harmonia axyridis]|uniref:uncharacterized protein LOC123675891 n=1 Tax=Harmonia axyridis TaxID=115357 RepID=UPI001E275A4C|nr:uncharacterized protein LOC123675891 [Harmonia axyridis]
MNFPKNHLELESDSSEPFRQVQSSMEMFGIWAEKRTTKHSIFRASYIIICIMFNVSCCMGFYHQLKTKKIPLICSNFAMLLVGGYGSVAILILNRKAFNVWLTDMFQREKFLNNNPNNKLKQIYRSALEITWPKAIFQLNKWSILVAEIMLAGVFLIYTSSKLNVEEECVASEECSMIYIGYYYSPWDVDVHYWLANIENITFGVFCCAVVYWRDMYLTCFMCYLRCKLEVVSYVVGHLDEFIACGLSRTEYSSEIDHILKQCIQEHQNIFQEFLSLHKYLSKIFCAMLLVNTLVIVNTTVIIFQEDNTSSFAIFVYCGAFYGCTHLYLMLSQSEELTLKSLQLADSIYSSNWYEMEVKHQKIFYIMLLRAQKPFALSCGDLFPANLNTFMKTMKTVYTIVNAVINLNK